MEVRNMKKLLIILGVIDGIIVASTLPLFFLKNDVLNIVLGCIYVLAVIVDTFLLVFSNKNKNNQTDDNDLSPEQIEIIKEARNKNINHINY